MSVGKRVGAVPVLAGGIVGLVVTLPLLAPGFVLTYDLAFVPKARLSADLLGLGTHVPRGVPFGLLAALAARVVTGEVVEKALLVAILVVATWGAARLVPSERPAARAAAGVLFAWNPFVYERLVLGHAPFLLSYAVMPWAVAAALRLRRGGSTAWGGLVLALAAASFASPYGGVIAGAVALAVVASPPSVPGERPRHAASVTAAVSLAVNLPWLVPSLLRSGGLPSPSVAFDLFRARSDSPLGLAGSLASLGGSWRTDLAPPGRSAGAWIPAFVVIAVMAVVGWRTLVRRWPLGAVRGMVAASVLGFALALGVSFPFVGHGIRWVGEHAPGGGILRDGQKFVAPLALALAVGFGLGVERLLAAIDHAGAGRRVRVVLVAVLVALPVALAPTLAWGESGRLFTAHYPPSWDRARSAMGADPAPGGILVLPWHLYLPYRFDRDRVVIQPATAYFTRPAVVSDVLEVGRAVVPPEDPWSALADPVSRGTGPLAPALPRMGIRYVLLIHEADWRTDVPRMTGLEMVLSSTDVSLYRSPQPARVPSFPTAPVVPVVAGDVLALAIVGAAAVALRRRRRT